MKAKIVIFKSNSLLFLFIKLQKRNALIIKKQVRLQKARNAN